MSAYDITNNFVKEAVEETRRSAKVLNGIQVAKKLGTNIVRVFSGDIQDDKTYENLRLDWIIEGFLKKCAEIAEKRASLFSY